MKWWNRNSQQQKSINMISSEQSIDHHHSHNYPELEYLEKLILYRLEEGAFAGTNKNLDDLPKLNDWKLPVKELFC